MELKPAVEFANCSSRRSPVPLFGESKPTFASTPLNPINSPIFDSKFSNKSTHQPFISTTTAKLTNENPNSSSTHIFFESSKKRSSTATNLFDPTYGSPAKESFSMTSNTFVPSNIDNSLPTVPGFGDFCFSKYLNSTDPVTWSFPPTVTSPEFQYLWNGVAPTRFTSTASSSKFASTNNSKLNTATVATNTPVISSKLTPSLKTNDDAIVDNVDNNDDNDNNTQKTSTIIEPKLWCETDTIIKQESYIWSIKNFKYRIENDGQHLESSIFTSDNEEKYNWRIDLSSNYRYDAGAAMLTLKVHLIDYKKSANNSKRVTISLSIINNDNKKTHKTGSDTMPITIPDDGIITYPKFAKLRDIFDKNKNNLPDGTLTILLEVGIMTGTSTTCKKIKQFNVINDDSINNRMYDYFKNGKFSDVVLDIAGTQLKAHKMILSVHSPVFTAMFDKDIIKETVNDGDGDADGDDNVIKINDIELDVALQILEFVYTNKAPSKIDLHVDALMAASHKYQIDRLRNLCEEVLYKNIKIDNAVKTLIIAELHGTEEFKKFIIEFFKNHGSLLKSNDFRNLEKDYPNLAIEVLRGIAIETASDK